MRSISCSPSLSNKHSSTFVAFAENSAKLTPSPFQVAPSGNGSPSRRRDLRVTGVFGKSVGAFMPAIPSLRLGPANRRQPSTFLLTAAEK